MRIMVGCEESQVVCKAFRDAGHEAYSCDLVDTRGNPDWHIKGDIMDNLDGWDLIILHPVCTSMALSGNRWYGKNMPRHQERIDSLARTIELWNKATSKCRLVAMENPKSVLFPKLRQLGAVIQYVQPWLFGHKENKETGFALYNLPKLEETCNVKKWVDLMPKSETDKVHRMPPGPNRKRDRSVTYPGIAAAMVKFWG